MIVALFVPALLQLILPPTLSTLPRISYTIAPGAVDAVPRTIRVFGTEARHVTLGIGRPWDSSTEEENEYVSVKGVCFIFSSEDTEVCCTQVCVCAVQNDSLT